MAADESKNRVRYNFIETVTYSGVKVSSDVAWHWRSAQINPVGPSKYAQDDSYAGDNRVLNTLTVLTPDLGPSPIPNFTVTGSTPATAAQGQVDVAGGVTGTLLNSGMACQRMVYLVLETSTATTTTFQPIIKLNIDTVVAGAINGTYSIPGAAQLGAHKVKVFILDKARTSPNMTTITVP